MPLYNFQLSLIINHAHPKLLIMKTKTLLLLFAIALYGCDSNLTNADLNKNGASHQVLMMKVDYTTNTFQGGTEFKFTGKSDNFTIETEYTEPSDFGSVKLEYKELNETLFFGTIHWMGLGKMTFPKSINPANMFKATAAANYVSPVNGFEDIFNPDERELDYEKPWMEIQYYLKVREYLTANPNQKVKMFLYTPSVGSGNPKDWSWIIYLNM